MSGSTASSPKLPRFNGPFSIQKFYHDSDAWGNKAKSNYLSVDLDVISFVLFPQASEPNENFNILIPSLSICDQLSKQQAPFGVEFVPDILCSEKRTLSALHTHYHIAVMGEVRDYCGG